MAAFLEDTSLLEEPVAVLRPAQDPVNQIIPDPGHDSATPPWHTKRGRRYTANVRRLGKKAFCGIA